jgi:hypothetical protein
MNALVQTHVSDFDDFGRLMILVDARGTHTTGSDDKHNGSRCGIKRTAISCCCLNTPGDTQQTSPDSTLVQSN